MASQDPIPDPETPEWSIAWAAKEVLRRHLGPRFDRRLSARLAAAIVARLRLIRRRVTSNGPDRKPIDSRTISRARMPPMAIAGLWERWRSKEGPETKESFTIVTTAANRFAAQFHDRMPVILEQDSWDLWLKGEADVAAALMIPPRENVLIERRVSKAINNVKNTGPEVLAPI